MNTNPSPRPRLEFTTAPFVRSHGRRPSGRGSWAFQSTTTDRAFDADLRGDVVFVSGTLTEAKAELRSRGFSGLMAVLP